MKTLQSTYHNIKQLKSIEVTYGIKLLDVGFEIVGDVFMDDNTFALLKSLFKNLGRASHLITNARL